ncbi:helix-turn-helix domain-containing protein [Treponema phagedenis]|uniref:helix-turn-helix domain-containing protein n=1 Tax=Treponema phagedenis TaxID=162 RepID=UPI0011E6B3FE|nr:helix-turn-helix transcriptional regulator [Treponema phagedenis]QEK06232.1 helix-turn-helix transcriptional regulator [Treponema phagedenis]
MNKSLDFYIKFRYLLYMLDFWIRVKDLIKEQNTTQDKIATQINERADNFSRWIQKDRLPNAEQSYKIADALGVSVEYLVTGKEKDNAPKITETKDLLLKAIENLDTMK